MAHHLILHQGQSAERRIDLDKPLVTVGRTHENDVFVLDKSLSRRHAQIETDGRSVVITDLGSKNGTFVNGERVTSRPLRPGDRILCGDVELYLASGDAASSPRMNPTLVRNLGASIGAGAISELISMSPSSVGPDGSPRSALRVRPSSQADQRAQDKLQILLRVSQLLSSPEDIDTLLAKILDLVFQILDVDRAAILMVNAETGKLEQRLTRTSSTTSPDEAVYSHHIVEYVRDKSVAALFSDARLDPRLDDAASVYAQSIRASMCAPLKPRDQVLGVLYVDNQMLANRFTEEDLDFLVAFANQAAIAIENAMLYRRIEEEAVLRNNLLRFFPPTTIKRIIGAGGAKDTLATMETEVTALFADISGFTAMSARMEPLEVVEILNEYFPAIADCVFRHEGTLEKYIGDALLAVWGAPFKHDDDTDRAIKAAAEMQLALRRLNQRWAGRRKIGIHVGLNTGKVAAGNIGSEHYLQYATIGDATNMASRICGVATEGEIVISQATMDRWPQRSLPVEALRPVMVRGRNEPLQCYRVIWDIRNTL